ncbi:hypothetical protein LTR66_006572 [Elasticomyces elasticus]|nr:hypothetical protein LTR66_006572 [Elasticomyces elasticus]
MALPTTTDESSALLTRLSQRPDVQSTLVLSRDTGAIVRTSGLISRNSSASLDASLPASSSANGDSSDSTASGIRSAEEVAQLIWSFMSAAGTLVSGLQDDEELKLLRLRTKKNELVIVPDNKFILVVIHDTPPA